MIGTPKQSLKRDAQCDLQILHRVRERLVNARTALINQLRALLLERGIILPKGRVNLMRRLEDLMAGDPVVSPRARALLADLRDERATLDIRVKQYDDELAALTREDVQARQLSAIPGIGGIGVINATALLAAIGYGCAFAKGRDLAAWLGLTPRQHSTGGKMKLLGISKRENGKRRRNPALHGSGR